MTNSGAAGLPAVTVDEAHQIVMPLTPRLPIAVGHPNGTGELTDSEVDSYNELQVRHARDNVFHRPGADFAADIAILHA